MLEHQIMKQQKQSSLIGLNFMIVHVNRGDNILAVLESNLFTSSENV